MAELGVQKGALPREAAAQLGEAPAMLGVVSCMHLAAVHLKYWSAAQLLYRKQQVLFACCPFVHSVGKPYFAHFGCRIMRALRNRAIAST